MPNTDVAAIAEDDGSADLLADRASAPKPYHAAGTGVPVGEYAPAFVLPGGDRGSFGFADLLGGPFVLHFYSGSEDSWLRQTACLNAISPTPEMLGVGLVAIVCASPSRTRHLETFRSGYPVLLDWEPKALVSRIYGFNHNKASPEMCATYLVDRRGVIQWIAFDRTDVGGGSTVILEAVRQHLSRPSPVDTSD
jgi:peroxiredoxin